MNKTCSIPKCDEPYADFENSWILDSGPLSAKVEAAGFEIGAVVFLCEQHNAVLRFLATSFVNYHSPPYLVVFAHPDLMLKGHTCEVPKCKKVGKNPLLKGLTSIMWFCAQHHQQLLPTLKIAKLSATLKNLAVWTQQPFCPSCGVGRCLICLRCTSASGRATFRCTQRKCRHQCKNGHSQAQYTKPCKKCGAVGCTACPGAFCSICNKCNTCDKKCPECEECTKICSCYGESDVALSTWNLPASFNLKAAAARFYTLIEKADVEPVYRPDLEKYAKELATVFGAYLDMAIGGEIRYGSHKCEGVTELLPRIAGRYQDRDVRQSRGKAWFEWKELRDEYSTSILQEAEDALFQGDWEGNLGGPMWGECAKTLRMHEEGEYNDIVFVDQAFSLEHNNGCVFNKLWQTGGLKGILNSVFEGKIDEIVRFLPIPQRSKYKAWKEYGGHTFR